MINTLTWQTSCGLLDITHSKSRGIFKLEFRATGIYVDVEYSRYFGRGDIYEGDDFDYVYPSGTSDAILAHGPKSVKMISEGCGRSAVKITYEITTHGHKHVKSIKIPSVNEETHDDVVDKKDDVPRVVSKETKTEDVETKKVRDDRDHTIDLNAVLVMAAVLMVLVDFVQSAIFSITGVKVPWIIFYLLLDQWPHYPLGLLLYYGLKNLH